MSDDPIALFLNGRIAANVALARMVLSGLSPEAVAARLSRHPTADTEPLSELLNRRGAALGQLAEAARRVDHAASGPDALDQIREGFDAAARIAPDMSVAAYTLGDPALVGAATDELLHWLASRDVLRPNSDVLDLGCGIGRVAGALASRVRSVLGIDVSREMVAEARRRHQGIPQLRFEVTKGRGLWPAREGGEFDLILAVDAFPYLVQAGVAERHVADAAGLLRSRGALAILNLSYRGIEQDRGDARSWAASYGFVLTCDGEQPFRLWDGRCFLLFKRAG